MSKGRRSPREEEEVEDDDEVEVAELPSFIGWRNEKMEGRGLVPVLFASRDIVSVI